MKLLKTTMKNLKTGIVSFSPAVGIILFTLCIITMGCTLIKLKRDVKKILQGTAIVGRIQANFSGNGPIIVAACAKHENLKIVNYSVLHESGEYEIGVLPDDYYVFAYWDKNSNLVYDVGEPAGQYGDPKVIHASTAGIVFDVDFVIPAEGRDIVIAHGTRMAPVTPQKLYSRQAGVITDLDDERFSEENGSRGFWEPASFFSELGGNIYFLEKYDPEKTPILFIHGVGGTPAGWRYFLDHIDRKRFQPWFFYYPTGMRINSMSYLLLWKLSNLQTKYKFDKIYFTAHSMGGLVARSFIVNYHREFPYVKLFISMATPWGGDKMAEYGVHQSPVVIPSWIDLQPEGDFIQSLYRKKMPKYTSFYMFYGHKGNRNPFRSNNDGTITLSSILDYRPQSEAKMNYAFNEDHTSMLFSPEVISQYNTILDAFDDKQKASPSKSGGYIKINFAYQFEFKGVRPRPALILRPVDQKTADIFAYVSEKDNGKIFGPFPSGQYRASMITMAARTIQKYLPVTIEVDKTKELDFVFIPEGEILGYLTKAIQREDKYAGRPDYVYRPDDKKINLQSVTLKGNGIHRTLSSIKAEDGNYYDLYINRADYCYNTAFGFFGLPAGEYDLLINAEGYKSVEKKYTVIPGKPMYFRPTELPPDENE